MEEVFNPKEYTVKELVKKVLNDLEDFKNQYEQDKKNNELKFKVTELEADIKRINAWISENEGQARGAQALKGWIAWVLAAIAAIFGIVQYLKGSDF